MRNGWNRTVLQADHNSNFLATPCHTRLSGAVQRGAGVMCGRTYNKMWLQANAEVKDLLELEGSPALANSQVLYFIVVVND